MAPFSALFSITSFSETIRQHELRLRHREETRLRSKHFKPLSPYNQISESQIINNTKLSTSWKNALSSPATNLTLSSVEDFRPYLDSLPKDVIEKILDLLEPEEVYRGIAKASKQNLTLVKDYFYWQKSKQLNHSQLETSHLITLGKLFPNITSLSIHNTDLNRRSLKEISTQFSPITTLHLENLLNHKLETLEIVQAFPKLCKLSIKQHSPMILSLSHVRHLKVLSIEGNLQLRILQGFKSLESLFISLNDQGDEADEEQIFLEILQHCISLKEIHVKKSKGISDNVLSLISEKFPKLEILEIEDCPHVTDLGVKNLIDKCSFISEISLAKNHQLSFTALENLALMKHLRKINLSNCIRLSRENLEVLLAKLPHLEEIELNILHSNLSLCAIENILKNAKKLRKLSFKGCFGFDLRLFDTLFTHGKNLTHLSFSLYSDMETKRKQVIDLQKNCLNLLELNIEKAIV